MTNLLGRRFAVACWRCRPLVYNFVRLLPLPPPIKSETTSDTLRFFFLSGIPSTAERKRVGTGPHVVNRVWSVYCGINRQALVRTYMIVKFPLRARDQRGASRKSHSSACSAADGSRGQPRQLCSGQ